MSIGPKTQLMIDTLNAHGISHRVIEGPVLFADEVDPAPDPELIERKIAFQTALLDGTLQPTPPTIVTCAELITGKPNIPAIKAELMDLAPELILEAFKRLTYTEQWGLIWQMTDHLKVYPVVTLDAVDILDQLKDSPCEDEAGNEYPLPTLDAIADACNAVSQQDWTNEYSTARDAVEDILYPAGNLTQANHDEA